MSFSVNVMYDAGARVRKLRFVMTFMCRRNPILIRDGTDPSPDTPGTPEMSWARSRVFSLTQPTTIWDLQADRSNRSDSEKKDQTEKGKAFSSTLETGVILRNMRQHHVESLRIYTRVSETVSGGQAGALLSLFALHTWSPLCRVHIERAHRMYPGNINLRVKHMENILL